MKGTSEMTLIVRSRSPQLPRSKSRRIVKKYIKRTFFSQLLWVGLTLVRIPDWWQGGYVAKVRMNRGTQSIEFVPYRPLFVRVP